MEGRSQELGFHTRTRLLIQSVSIESSSFLSMYGWMDGNGTATKIKHTRERTLLLPGALSVSTTSSARIGRSGLVAARGQCEQKFPPQTITLADGREYFND